MPIAVTCPKCFKRFQVSDKFAGKKGPCPNCKNILQVPTKDETVVVHTPDDGAPKDRSGQSIAKPIQRTETEVTRRGLIVTIGAILAAIAAAVVIRLTVDPTALWMRIAGVIIVAPPLVWAGYSFARDSELAGYEGTELRNRVAVASLLLPATWLLYWLLPGYLFDLDYPSQMSLVWFGIMMALMLGVGGIISTATFELEYLNGVIHAGLYIVATLLLAVIAGIPLAGQPTSDPYDQVYRTERSGPPPVQWIDGTASVLRCKVVFDQELVLCCREPLRCCREPLRCCREPLRCWREPVRCCQGRSRC